MPTHAVPGRAMREGRPSLMVVPCGGSLLTPRCRPMSDCRSMIAASVLPPVGTGKILPTTRFRHFFKIENRPLKMEFYSYLTPELNTENFRVINERGGRYHLRLSVRLSLRTRVLPTSGGMFPRLRSNVAGSRDATTTTPYLRRDARACQLSLTAR